MILRAARASAIACFISLLDFCSARDVSLFLSHTLSFSLLLSLSFSFSLCLSECVFSVFFFFAGRKHRKPPVFPGIGLPARKPCKCTRTPVHTHTHTDGTRAGGSGRAGGRPGPPESRRDRNDGTARPVSRSRRIRFLCGPRGPDGGAHTMARGRDARRGRTENNSICIRKMKNKKTKTKNKPLSVADDAARAFLVSRPGTRSRGAFTGDAETATKRVGPSDGTSRHCVHSLLVHRIIR